MPHSWPATTSRASSLKRLSCDSLPWWTTTLSRMRRTLAPRCTTPSVTRQPATLPTFEMLKISRISALPRKVSRRGGAGLGVGADMEAEYDGAGGRGQLDVGFRDAADGIMDHPPDDLVGGELL